MTTHQTQSYVFVVVQYEACEGIRGFVRQPHGVKSISKVGPAIQLRASARDNRHVCVA